MSKNFKEKCDNSKIKNVKKKKKCSKCDKTKLNKSKCDNIQRLKM